MRPIRVSGDKIVGYTLPNAWGGHVIKVLYDVWHKETLTIQLNMVAGGRAVELRTITIDKAHVGDLITALTLLKKELNK